MASRKYLFLLALLLLAAPAARGENIVLKPVQPVLVDDKEGMMKNPQGVACDESGFIVADSGNSRLLSYGYAEGIVSGGTPIRVAQLGYPIRLQKTSKGEILALDGKQRRIVRLTDKGAFVGYVDVQIGAAAVVPRSFKIDSHDAIYVLDIAAEKVVVADAAGKFVRALDLPADHGVVSDLAVDNDGTIFVVDSSRRTVYVAAKGNAPFTTLGGDQKENMDFPSTIAVDPRGNLFVVDQDGGGIVVLGPDGSFKTRLLTPGRKVGSVYYPAQLCMNKKGDVLVADRDNNRIQIFELVK